MTKKRHLTAVPDVPADPPPPEYVQARSSQGFLIHALPGMGQRSGMVGQYIRGRALCGKVKGTDGWGMPTMIVLRSGHGDRPFTLNDPPAKVCSACWKKLAVLKGRS